MRRVAERKEQVRYPSPLEAGGLPYLFLRRLSGRCGCSQLLPQRHHLHCRLLPLLYSRIPLYRHLLPLLYRRLSHCIPPPQLSAEVVPELLPLYCRLLPLLYCSVPLYRCLLEPVPELLPLTPFSGERGLSKGGDGAQGL